MKKTLLLLIPLMLTLGACNTRKKPEVPNIPDTPDVPDKPDWGETGIKNILFKGDKTRTGLTNGSQLGDSKFDTALTSLINTQTDNSLTALGGHKCAFQDVGGDTGSDSSLTIGTGKYDGLIYFTFNIEIVQIDVAIQNYFNPHHDYQTNKDVTGIDVDTEVVMCSYSPTDGVKESKEVSLATTDAVNIPNERSETLEFKEPTNTIAFYNNAASHRTYIHSISITYLVK